MRHIIANLLALAGVGIYAVAVALPAYIVTRFTKEKRQ